MQFQFLQDYKCRCYNQTQPTMCGGMLATSFVCKGCRDIGLAMMRSDFAEQHHQLSLEMDGIVEPAAPPAARALPEGS